jgi:outer membrane beta-barrel protein
MFSLLFCIIVGFTAHASAVCPEPPEKDGLARKGLGQREFIKSLRHEINLYGGVYANEIMGAGPLGGLSYTFHFTEDFAVEAGFAYSKFKSHYYDPVLQNTSYKLIEPHDARLYYSSLIWHPFHGKFMFLQSAIPHFDFYFLAGVGTIDSRITNGLTYSAGVGIKIFINSWLSLRLELRDNINTQKVMASEVLTNNISLGLGVGFWIPFSK